MILNTLARHALIVLTTGLMLVLPQVFASHSAQKHIAKTIMEDKSTQDDPSWTPKQKALIIQYLLESVSWPVDGLDNEIVNVCMLGKFENKEHIYKIHGNAIHPKNTLNIKSNVQRKIAVREVSNLKEAQNNCQLIYISDSESHQAAEIIAMFINKPVLLISDTDRFALQGGSMNFVDIKGIVALTVNLDTLKKSKLIFDLKSFGQITVIPTPEELNE